jgi:uroporphyrinogen-III synthase
MILVTRPEPAARRTAAALSALGQTVLLDPLLRLGFAPPARLFSTPPEVVVVTSANALRAIAGHADLDRLRPLPVWAVGERTAAAAAPLGLVVRERRAVDAATLARRLAASIAPGTRILHLAGADRVGDLAAWASAANVRLEVTVVYRAVPAGRLAPETVAALARGEVAAVAHYSRRTAEAYLGLAAAAGLGDAALAPVQLCLSERVAVPLRLAGAADVRVAARPEEPALFDLIIRA